MYSAELAYLSIPIPRELDGGRAGAVALHRAQELLLRSHLGLFESRRLAQKTTPRTCRGVVVMRCPKAFLHNLYRRRFLSEEPSGSGSDLTDPVVQDTGM
jgi:hypothetical protein